MFALSVFNMQVRIVVVFLTLRLSKIFHVKYRFRMQLLKLQKVKHNSEGIDSASLQRAAVWDVLGRSGF